MLKILQENIRRRLTTMKLSLTELGRQAGIRTSTISSILCGSSKNPTIKVIYAIAQVFQCSIEDLIIPEYKQSHHRPTQTIIKWLQTLEENWHPILHDEIYNFIQHYISLNRIEAKAWQVLLCFLEIYAYSSSKQQSYMDISFAEWITNKTFKNIDGMHPIITPEHIAS
jgi:transcriptional regulator with XRE-family HTH domain